MNKFFVLIGTTGVGKTYYSKLLDSEYGVKRIKALTTRPERPTHPNEYIHVSREQFEAEVDAGNMLEYNTFDEHLYGRRKADVLDGTATSHAIIEMSANRISTLKESIPDAIVIHLTLEEPIVDNMVARVSDRNWSEDKIKQRIEVLKLDLLDIQEVVQSGLVDHEIVTIEGDKEATLTQILSLIGSYSQDALPILD